ncbi:MAG: LysM peptidoglycan-binding domain-containing protein [Verrucomicrobiota bacterium]|nr:LysM peptidoglycan-binding domain-containing protein [Verrucomicrobiota bacterium]
MMYLGQFINISKILSVVLLACFASIGCKTNSKNSAKYDGNQSNKRFSLNPFGFKKRIGQDVSQIRNDLTQTNYRVSSLEGEVKTIQSSPVFSNPNYTTQAQSIGKETPPLLTGKSHIVSGGETLSSISRKYKIGLDRLISENKILDPNALQIGQEIFIPAQKGQPAVPRHETNTSPADLNADHHIVTGGDTLNRIAKRYGVSTDAIVSANSLENPNNIKIGQRITLPSQSGNSPPTNANSTKEIPENKPEITQNSENPEEIVAPEGHGFYQIVDGDTLQSIAISFGTNADELKRLNKLSGDKNSLHIGDYILVPVPDDSLYES